MSDQYRILDYSKVRPRALCSRGAMPASLHANETVLGRVHRPPRFADIKTRAQAEGGGQWLRDQVADWGERRKDINLRRRNGESCADREAETLSFRSVRDVRALQKAMDFPVEFKVYSEDGLSSRSVTTSAFALLASSMAVADVNMAYEGVPTVAEFLVRDLDDVQPHSEIGQALDFGALDPTTVPKPLGELEEFKEVGAEEDRYSVLHFKDGYQRAFSQEMIDRSDSRIFGQLTDLGAGAREIMEFMALRRIIDYDGSASSPTFHVMNRNGAAASLFSATANTPSARTPSGTRINNNALATTDNLEALRLRLASMRNSRKFPVANWPEVILVPDALWVTGHKLLNSSFQPAVFNEVNFYGPDGPGGPINLISTPMLDLLSTTHWYGGRPTRQFVRKWSLRPEISTMGGSGTEAFLRTREGFRTRIGWDMLVGARDHIYWVESSDDTAGPKD